ncbi:MAG: TonB-dependent receptor [Bacteroides sp.]|nr:TonB-dependent receptor [Bacteroides sp.]
MLMAALLCFVFDVQAQNGSQITGKVVDAMGELPGVSVVVKGTTNGTTTDLEGRFTLKNVKPADVIQFSFIGYKQQDVKVGNQKVLNITMVEDAQALDEIVVVGYQEVRKRDLTGSVGETNMKDLLNTPVTTFDQALGGRIAGVNVSSGEGRPGATMNITIRGNNSLTQENTPLYIIDGFPLENADAGNSINPNDIESINILKDASATAIYGSRGANGVVIITTKKGKVGRAQFSYDGSFGVSYVTKKIEMMDAYEFVKLQEEIDPTGIQSTYYMTYNDKTWSLEDYRNIAQNNYQDEVFRAAWQQSHNLRVTGGSENARYNASLSYYNQDGILLNTGYERLQARMNTLIKRDKLTISLTTNFSRAIRNGASPSSSSYSGMNNLFYSVWGYRPVNRPDGTLEDLLNNVRDEDIEASNDYRFNPIADLKNSYRKYYVNNLQLNGYVQYEFIKGLKLKISGGYTYDNRHTDIFNNSKTRYGGPTSTDKVNAEIVRQERLTWLNENILSYQTNFKKKHFLNAMLGLTLQNSDYEYYSYSTNNIPNESLGMAGMDQGSLVESTSSKSSWSMLSYLASFNYNYKGKYYATASFRADGSSKFSEENRFGYFPSVALAWSFTEEDFMKSIKPVLSTGKVRVSWGLSGNNRIGEYDRFALLDMIKYHVSSNAIPNTVYPFGGDNSNVGMAPTSLPNDDLKWETTEQWNLGFDLGFFKDRLNLTVDLYSKTTRDLLLNATLPYSSGYVSAMKNVGKVRNQGIEVTLNTTNIQSKNFRWTTNFNIAFNKNEVLALTEGQTSLQSTASFDQNFNSQPNYIAKVGHPMGMMYGYIYEGTYKYDDFDQSGSTYTLKGNIPYYTSESSTQPGMPKYKDLNGDGIINSNDRTMIGRGTPIHTGGFTNNFEYKNFDLSIFFQWSYGNDILNANRLFFESGFNKKKELNQFATYANRWTAENPTSDIPAATNSASNLVISSRVVEDGSFLRLKTVTLGYTLPQKFLNKYKIEKARIYVAASNIWTWSDYSGYDPEVSIRDSALTPGLDFSSYPRAFTMNFGLNLSF